MPDEPEELIEELEEGSGEASHAPAPHMPAAHGAAVPGSTAHGLGHDAEDEDAPHHAVASLFRDSAHGLGGTAGAGPRDGPHGPGAIHGHPPTQDYIAGDAYVGGEAYAVGEGDMGGHAHAPRAETHEEAGSDPRHALIGGFAPEAAPFAAEPRHAPAAMEYEPMEGAPEVASWEERRGNLAAALASMSEAIEADAPHAHHDADRAAAGARRWDAGTGALQGGREIAGFGGTAPLGDVPARDALLGTATSMATTLESYARDLGADPADPHWPGAAPLAAAPRITDPELSVREVLKSVILDPRDDEPGDFGMTGLPRSLFGEPERDEDDAAPYGHGSGDEAWAQGRQTGVGEAASSIPRHDPLLQSVLRGDPPIGVRDNIDSNFEGTASQRAFSERWESFSAAERRAQTEAADPALSPEAQAEADRFESDIAGLFRQQTPAKRAFGHMPPPPPARAGEDSLVDYDGETDAAPTMADDRYMADSPLDADAAALQAALEGSLRERHVEESRAGSGGGLALAAAWAVFLSVLSGVMLAFVNFRDDIVVALPGMSALYRGVGLGVQEQQVDFGTLNYRWTVADGKPMIEVTGQIINKTDREILVPRVLINVRDKETSDTIKATATVRGEPLAAGETADFTLEFLSPSRTVSQIELAFAEKTD